MGRGRADRTAGSDTGEDPGAQPEAGEAGREDPPPRRVRMRTEVRRQGRDPNGVGRILQTAVGIETSCRFEAGNYNEMCIMKSSLL